MNTIYAKLSIPKMFLPYNKINNEIYVLNIYREFSTYYIGWSLSIGVFKRGYIQVVNIFKVIFIIQYAKGDTHDNHVPFNIILCTL